MRHSTLSFGSGFRVMRLSPLSGSMLSEESAVDSISLSLCPFCSCVCSLSLSLKINKSLKKKKANPPSSDGSGLVGRQPGGGVVSMNLGAPGLPCFPCSTHTAPASCHLVYIWSTHLSAAALSYKVTGNVDLENMKQVLLGETRARTLQASAHILTK